MKARFMVEEPKEIECTLKLTMTIGEWERLRDQLDQTYPSWKLSQAITFILTDVRKVFYAEQSKTFDE